MNNALLVFLGVFLTFAGSWYGVVLQSYRQLAAQQEVTLFSGQRYPAPRGGHAERGAEIYRQEGCYYCHSQQVRADDVAFNLYIKALKPPAGIDPVKFTNDVVKAIITINGRLNAQGAMGYVRRPPQPIKRDVTLAEAEAAFRIMAAIGAEGALGRELIGIGPDIERDWGDRRTVAQDFLRDSPVMLGSIRHGPDLANVGVRRPQVDWNLAHLFEPRSSMPSYRHLFEVRPKGTRRGVRPLSLGAVEGVPAGMEILPTPEARALVAYLISLRAEASLTEALTPMAEITVEEERDGLEGGGDDEDME
jgi:cbb3-type cytochrome oxidase cytochrome c subunit